jgi:hypothetical protein
VKKHASILILLLGAAVFTAGLFQLFKLRFEAGDVYPPYSSLRSDPLGTMALFESLADMPRLTVVRDFSPDNRLPPGRGTTYLHLAATPAEWLDTPLELAAEIQGYLSAGGRLIIAFLPETSRPFTPAASPSVPATGPPNKAKGPMKRTSFSHFLRDRLGVELGFEPLQAGESGSYNPVRVVNGTGLPLPDSLDWHGGMIFTNVNAAWTKIYSRETNAVMIERKFGLGSVVLMTDCFCFSNEAMIADRHAELLAWLIGPARQIEFDEAHLGLVETSTVATLMRNYHLHGLIAGVLLLTGLFIWKYSASFLPREAEVRAQSEVAGKQAAEGFINLLRRNIAPRDVLRVCFDEWTKSFARRGAHSIARVDQAQAIFAAEVARARLDQDPVRAYREICRALKGPPPGGTSSTSPDASHSL